MASNLKCHITGKKATNTVATGNIKPGTSADAKNVQNNHFQLLREFDLDWKFGPCSGITRLERWERAANFGLNPPLDIQNLITSNINNKEYTQSCWSSYDL